MSRTRSETIPSTPTSIASSDDWYAWLASATDDQLQTALERLEERTRAGEPCPRCGTAPMSMADLAEGEDEAGSESSAYASIGEMFQGRFLPECACVQDVLDEQERRRESARSQERERRRQERVHRRIERNRPGRFRDASVGTWPGRDDHPAVAQAAAEYVAAFDPNDEASVLMLGPVGTGKTHLLYGMANDLIRADREVLVVNVAHWIQELNFAIGNKANTDELIEPLYEAELLGLVDLGKEATTEFTRRTLYLLLEHRWQQMRPLLIDSNFARFEALADHYAGDPVMQEAIASRIGGMCAGNVWTLGDGTDHRLAA